MYDEERPRVLGAASACVARVSAPLTLSTPIRPAVYMATAAAESRLDKVASDRDETSRRGRTGSGRVRRYTSIACVTLGESKLFGHRWECVT